MVNSKVSFAAEQQTGGLRVNNAAILPAVLFTLMISSCDLLFQEVVNGVPPTAQPAEITSSSAHRNDASCVFSREFVDYTAQPIRWRLRFVFTHPLMKSSKPTRLSQPTQRPCLRHADEDSDHAVILGQRISDHPDISHGLLLALTSLLFESAAGLAENYRVYVLGRDRPINEVIEYVSCYR